jgi:diaminobutyrate-2-oxoglutarate transaminase
MDVFALYDLLESSVRTYCRSTPVVFSRGLNHRLYDKDGVEYLDFLAGCGALNYGHNDPDMKSALLDYIERDGLIMGLDFYFEAKTAFLEAFNENVIKSCGATTAYKLQFVGPTGTNAVEAALKLARKVTGRANIISFTNAYHGCTLGSLSTTGNTSYRSGSQGHLTQVYRAIYDGYMDGIDSAALLEKLMADPSSGIDNVAAIILESIQGEGGLNAATPEWAKKIEIIARRHGALLILDEVQSGCGRSGAFFGYQGLGIKPDMVTMAKSLSGSGLPLAMVMIRSDLDVWQPGEHTGTFRGNALAFVTATVALNKFWRDKALMTSVRKSEDLIGRRLTALAERHGLTRKGRGMMQGLQLPDAETAAIVQARCLEKRLLIENCGRRGEVMKILAALTIPPEDLERGLGVFEQVVDSVFTNPRSHSAPLASAAFAVTKRPSRNATTGLTVKSEVKHVLQN